MWCCHRYVRIHHFNYTSFHSPQACPALEPGKQPAVNAKLGAGVVRARERITDAATIKECHGASAAMQRPPFDAYMIVNTATQPVFRVDFEAALPAAVGSAASSEPSRAKGALLK